MRKFPALFPLLLGILFALQSCAPQAQPWPGPFSGAPALWHVTSGEGGMSGEAWLFGGIHSLPKELEWITPAMQMAMDKSDRLILEITNSDDQSELADIFRNLASSKNQPPLALRVDAANMPTALQLADSMGMKDSSIEQTEDWALALNFASAATAGIGQSGQYGTETVMKAQYKDSKKPIEQLETAQEQLGIFDALPKNAQRAMLNSVLEDAPYAKENYVKLVQLWMTGDVTALEEIMRAGLLKNPVIRENILMKRNQNWAEQIDAKIRTGQSPFIAVGAGHLVGENSLPQLMAAMGYRVERVQ